MSSSVTSDGHCVTISLDENSAFLWVKVLLTDRYGNSREEYWDPEETYYDGDEEVKRWPGASMCGGGVMCDNDNNVTVLDYKIDEAFQANITVTSAPYEVFGEQKQFSVWVGGCSPDYETSLSADCLKWELTGVTPEYGEGALFAAQCGDEILISHDSNPERYNQSYVVHFKKTVVSTSAVTSGDGRGDVSTSSVSDLPEWGSTVTFTATPEECSEFVEWKASYKMGCQDEVREIDIESEFGVDKSSSSISITVPPPKGFSYNISCKEACVDSYVFTAVFAQKYYDVYGDVTGCNGFVFVDRSKHHAKVRCGDYARFEYCSKCGKLKNWRSSSGSNLGSDCMLRMRIFETTYIYAVLEKKEDYGFSLVYDKESDKLLFDGRTGRLMFGGACEHDYCKSSLCEEE